ncbi:MAG TPA: DUF5715 family protein [Thermoanaerobaculia bacterium]|nr:DUF5715 family protein [Thermoanaerobaculia bacterium]
MRTARRAAAASLALLALPPALEAASLRGSRASLAVQERAARQHDYSYLRTSAQVREFAGAGLLVKLAGNRDYDLADVSFPYARPEVKTFVERLARQYRAACGETLVVTSLTRPKSRQPANASELSVHPTGMAVDLRQSRRASCRAWLEKTLLGLERRDLLEATRERWPPHYHVALFSARYRRYVAGLGDGDSDGASAVAAAGRRHEVRRGDTLWSLAKRYGTSVEGLQRANGMRSSGLKPGQTLAIPAAR